MRRRRDTARASGTSRNANTSGTRRQSSVVGQKDSERRHRRRRHHSVNEAISRLDVRVPLRLGQDGARPVQASAASTDPRPASAASSGGQPVDTSRDKPLPVAVVDDRPAADRRPAQLLNLPSRRTAVAGGDGSTFVGLDLHRLGRRSCSLDNVHALNSTADTRTYALITIAN